ncbi:KpsF/GutQ family sugar-phosphate isomerase [Candidatus Laterigemmans baculatus]|uniref:KpsF/GutQ family sugar-phosphate isomerase n=1 Tax=Candidatus Laterigemmans baculatus TaxID=2770505 RepID=UPI0013DB0C32|nr:KpsF/GutQ family sugar-phosphate isomerase [Candidatus Laterigemmans baculatus]
MSPARPLLDQAASTPPLTPLERLRLARDVMRSEAAAIEQIIDAVGPQIVVAAERIVECSGSIVVTGIGKAGLVAQKIVATLASTGSTAHFLHPSEAIHGDLGRVTSRDLVWVFSHSGQSEEVVRLLPALRRQSAGILATTADAENPLGKWADWRIEIGHVEEACPLGLAPTTSTTLMLSTGDAVALLASRIRGFTAHDFARFHPGGSLGRKLSKVDRWMRPRPQCRVASAAASVREVFSTTTCPARRSGAVMLVDDEGRLAGLFTDSDLVRLLELRRDEALDGPIAAVMTRDVQTVLSGSLLGDAISILAGRRISELPVLDAGGRPIGLLDITDVVSMSEVDPPTVPLRKA